MGTAGPGLEDGPVLGDSPDQDGPVVERSTWTFIVGLLELCRTAFAAAAMEYVQRNRPPLCPT